MEEQRVVLGEVPLDVVARFVEPVAIAEDGAVDPGAQASGSARRSGFAPRAAAPARSRRSPSSPRSGRGLVEHRQRRRAGVAGGEARQGRDRVGLALRGDRRQRLGDRGRRGRPARRAAPRTISMPSVRAAAKPSSSSPTRSGGSPGAGSRKRRPGTAPGRASAVSRPCRPPRPGGAPGARAGTAARGAISPSGDRPLEVQRLERGLDLGDRLGRRVERERLAGRRARPASRARSGSWRRVRRGRRRRR